MEQERDRGAEAQAGTQPLTTFCKGGWNSFVPVKLSANLPCTWATGLALGSGNVSVTVCSFHHPGSVGRTRVQMVVVFLTGWGAGCQGLAFGGRKVRP